ncbi:MAG: CDP-alcohol phosphatidyltransferase family protein, partial [Nocardioidaceae bacterium]
MRTVRTGPVIRPIAHLALLAALAGTVGLSGLGWVAGIACGVITNVGLARGLARSGSDALGPAGWVTFTRATLVGGVAALTADAFTRPAPVTTLVVITVVALVLDAVDGFVARRTHTSSRLGARFDMEVDAFLILVLSVYVARTTGWWVLAIGVARYAFVAAGWLLPWLRGSVPPRYWYKVVAAIQGIVLAFAAADVLPRSLTQIALAASLLLLTESFGREVRWLWRHRREETAKEAAVRLGSDDRKAGPLGARGKVRSTAAAVTTVVAFVLVWLALVAPHRRSDLTPGAFASIPIEGLVVIGLALVLPVRARRVVAGLFGALLGLLVILKVLDLGFRAVLDRPFDLLNDWYYLGPGVGVLNDSIGHRAAIAVVVGAVVAALAVLILMPWSALRLTHFAAGHRRTSIRAVIALGVVWLLAAVTGLQFTAGTDVASTSATGLAYDAVRQVRFDIQDRRSFAREIAADRFSDTPSDRLLTGLRGKDVLLVFVESYGRIAVQDSSFSPQVDAVLDAGTSQLRAAGFSSRSAFLTSPTFGAGSWLAHSTLQSGLWVNSQQRYNQLVRDDRLTLTDAFGRAGWRTVSDDPANTKDWPEGASFYHFDKQYDARNVGYHGPKFSYATMPDQYTLAAFRRLELTKTDRAPVMAEIDLVSSHHPWTPLPHLVDWSQVGDGSVFDGMPEQGESPDVAFRDPDKVRALYGQSIEYSMRSLISFVQTYNDPNLVVV